MKEKAEILFEEKKLIVQKKEKYFHNKELTKKDLDEKIRKET